MNYSERLRIFVKGVLMGMADTVPGVSGGTIAFITGIYERLIEGINSIDLKMPFYLFKGDFGRLKEAFFSVDFALFIPLGTGIVTAFLAFSKLMVMALQNYPAVTFGFFFGLILASALKVFGRVSEHSMGGTSFGFLGFLFGFLITGLDALASIHSLLMLFFAGFTAVFALILPGISGSFILLILGQYEYIINAVHGFSGHLLELTVFISGGVVSLFSFSKLLSYLFRKHEDITLLFLAGLMVGSLRLPLVEVVSEVSAGLSGYALPVLACFVGISGAYAAGSEE